MQKIKIAAICTDYSVNEHRSKNNLYGGIGYYRLYKPYEMLKEKYKDEFEIDIFNKELVWEEEKDKSGNFLSTFVQKYDIIITKAIDNGPAASILTFLITKNGNPMATTSTGRPEYCSGITVLGINPSPYSTSG